MDYSSSAQLPAGVRRPRQRTLIGTLTRAVIIAGLVLCALWATSDLLLQLVYEPQAAPDVAQVPVIVHARLAAWHTPYVPVARISPQMQHAVVAIEDRRFYQHHGIDIRSLLRVALKSWLPGQPDPGGSTLDIQLLRQTAMADETGVAGNLRLVAGALQLEDQDSKGQILELYLNAVYFGRGALGIAAASHAYFGESPARLDIAHAAFLAALIQLPSVYSAHPFGAVMRFRRRAVIEDMAAQGYITASQARGALQEPVRLLPDRAPVH